MDAASFIHPECTELVICDFDLYADGDRIDAPCNLEGWRALGERIGEHEKLENLGLGGFNAAAAAESLEALLRGIAQNRSVRELYFRECYGNWPMGILAPLYKNLHKLTLDDCNLSRSLSAALRGCADCSLKRIEWSSLWSYSPMDDDETAVEFIQSLAGLSRLNFLQLDHGCDIGLRGCYAMAALLRNPDCTLKVFWYGDKILGDEGLNALAAGLGENRTLRRLYLDYLYGITTEAWQSFASILSTPNCVLEGLGLGSWYSAIDDDVMVVFAEALRGNSRLKYLGLGERSTSSTNWAQVFGGEQMNRKISPHVLAWLGNDRWEKKSNCTAVYGFLRKMPTLWGNSCPVVRCSTRKGKAQS